MLEGLPELVAELSLEPVRSKLSWIEWSEDGIGNSTRQVQSDSYAFSYTCPTSALNHDGVPAMERIICRGLDDDHRDFEFILFKEGDQVQLLDAHLQCLGRYQQSDPQFRYLVELMLSIRALCCRVQRGFPVCV